VAGWPTKLIKEILLPKNSLVFCENQAVTIPEIVLALSLGKKVPQRNFSRNRTHGHAATHKPTFRPVK
jgi:hypothetical protein